MPAKRRFTETWLRSLVDRPPAADTTYGEAGRVGFLVRHRTGGALAFVARYQLNGRADWLHLGEFPSMTLEQAHEAHSDVRKQLALGLDPKAERERQRIERERQDERRRTVDAVTIRNVIAEWAWHHARRRRKRAREAVRLLRVHLLPSLKDKPAGAITKRDLVMIIDRVIARGSAVMANRLRDLMAQVFGFAAMRDLISASPAAGLLKNPGGAEQAKERSLARDEIRAFWSGLDDAKTKISRPIRVGLRLILVTAQRPGEVAQATFDQFDVKARTWTIPEHIAKNGRPHCVPLSDLAIELIDELRVLAKGRAHLLPSVHSKLKPDEPISERAMSRALKNNRVGGRHPTLFGCAVFTPHDLRRTAATHMTALGIERLHVGKLLNHSDKADITHVYDRHAYAAEKRRAVELWEAELRAIVSGKQSKVVALDRKRAAR